MAKKIATLFLVALMTLTCVFAFAEEPATTEWISVEEARQLFKEAIAEDCTFEVTCRSAYIIDGNTKAWLQLEAHYDGTGYATGLWNKDIMMPLSILDIMEEHGVTWESVGFVIDPEIFPYNSIQELVLDEDWGTIYISRARVNEFLEFCLEPATDTETN